MRHGPFAFALCKACTGALHDTTYENESMAPSWTERTQEIRKEWITTDDFHEFMITI